MSDINKHLDRIFAAFEAEKIAAYEEGWHDALTAVRKTSLELRSFGSPKRGESARLLEEFLHHENQT